MKSQNQQITRGMIHVVIANEFANRIWTEMDQGWGDERCVVKHNETE